MLAGMHWAAHETTDTIKVWRLLVLACFGPHVASRLGRFLQLGNEVCEADCCGARPCIPYCCGTANDVLMSNVRVSLALLYSVPQ